ncbi:hypothetical protein [Spirosoma utsteinense]|uniref:UDP-N-acetylmuramyl pentapeptide phosphotransferase/UDP-N-acetylglucosamine-1-phosphate transferase n=1 Tax=Spirosoma utsteinense TaxID=2585773 RepID=A0ABR6W6U0_9BACT|nr:hypothetical protein [Spirosoma utsteinense]MBC3786090.1 UDP-N-acetylmuramyl pentapeptide phosphotransferase/UDP-N-acetylglucosamine-1-phosphate transferase [Spirosoma utsteinense]MBC3792279.1 UDP-N-acetylmuramyl pentapeptide phosphotransferase/UDP-N-acetylglucosamine-1-phosphate transferase [Spirosoma utsteinense]
MSLAGYLITILALVVAQAGYLRLARWFGIIDRPNARSAHNDLTTIRGAGILFFLAGAGGFFYTGFAYPYFFAGLTLVATVSFLDDLRPLSRRYRLAAQAVGIALLLYETGLTSNGVWVLIGLVLVGVGVLNAWNFMDGINGMTAWYGMVTVGTLWSWQEQLGSPMAGSGLPFVFIALLIFSTVNARRQAICFAGDVGSISLAFAVLFSLVQVISLTQTYLPMLLVAVYGVDTGMTLLYRLCKRQNVFQAHRLHLFQLLVHKRNWPHLRVSGVYALCQLVINGLVVIAVTWGLQAQGILAGSVLALLAGLYVGLRRWALNE